MKLQGQKLRQMLAAEYALGTLRGAARRRFARAMLQDRGLETEVQFWEQRLADLGRGIRPVAPRDVVWTAIELRLNRSRVAPIKPDRTRLNLWRGWAALSTAASVILGFGLWQQINQPPQIVTQTQLVRVEVPVREPMPFVAVLQPAKSTALWKVTIYPEQGRIKVVVAGEYKLDEKNHSLELWAVAPDGPHSLGLLPISGAGEMPMPKDLPMPGDMATLAVSLEPHGGSPNGKPTQVLFAAPALRPI